MATHMMAAVIRANVPGRLGMYRTYVGLELWVGRLVGSAVGFGVDSAIEVTSSAAAHWWLRADLDSKRRERFERVTP